MTTLTVPRWRLAVGVLLATLGLLSAACSGEDQGACELPQNQVSGNDCTVTWTQCNDGASYQLSCSNTPPASSSSCKCTKNGVVGSSFASEQIFCLLPLGSMDEPANTGCGWNIHAE